MSSSSVNLVTLASFSISPTLRDSRPPSSFYWTPSTSFCNSSICCLDSPCLFPSACNSASFFIVLPLFTSFLGKFLFTSLSVFNKCLQHLTKIHWHWLLLQLQASHIFFHKESSYSTNLVASIFMGLITSAAANLTPPTKYRRFQVGRVNFIILKELEEHSLQKLTALYNNTTWHRKF